MDALPPVITIEELSAKYQRLGQEYQKARAQVTVLKKAVLDEQALNKSVQDGVTQRDQTIRKYEQEIDSLNFRNSQLSKRVEILQSELSKYESKGAKPVKQPNTQQTSISFIHEQELQMKIAENESLHKQLQEANTEHEARSQLLSSRLEELEQSKQNHEKMIEDCNSKNSVVIEKLEEERTMLEARLAKQTEDLKLANVMAESYKKKFQDSASELETKLESTNKLMKEKIPFKDSLLSEYNVLNVPVCDTAYQQKTQAIVEKITNNLIAFIGSFSDYHTYLEQRLQVFSSDIKKESISSVNAMFSSHLLKNAMHSRKLQHALKAVHEQSLKETFIMIGTLSSLKDIAIALRKYSSYLSLLMPYRSMSIEEECRSSTWSESIEKHNNDILNEEKKVVMNFSKLVSYVDVVVAPQISSPSRSACIRNISSIFAALNQCFKKICEYYVAKSADEHDHATYTNRLRTTDDFILSTVYSLESSSSKIASVFDEHMTFLASTHVYKRKGVPTSESDQFSSQVSMFHNKATNYIESLLQYSTTSSGSTTVDCTRTVESNGDISQEYLSSLETITKLEQEKEHWILEHKLLKAKYDKELKKAAMVEEELKTYQRHSPRDSSDDATNEVPVENGTSASEGSMNEEPVTGAEEAATRAKSGSTDSDQESLVKEYLYTRISELTKQLQISDSKCINFYQEAHSLYKQIVLADKNKQKLSNSLVESKKQVESLQDELETTKRSYEEQLGMFSDHLMGMNDKLTSQKDQIDELKTGGSGTGGFGIFQLPGRKK